MENGKIKQRIKALKVALSDRDIAKEGYEFFKDITPEKSGNAKRKTSLRDTEIVADYPYAGRLDQGYSRQAPKGMTEPTIKHLSEVFKKRIR